MIKDRASTESIFFEVAGLFMMICGDLSHIPRRSLRPYDRFLVACPERDKRAADVVIELTDTPKSRHKLKTDRRYESEDGEMRFTHNGDQTILRLNSPDGRLIGESEFNSGFSYASVYVDGTTSQRHYSFTTAVMMAFSFRGVSKGILLYHAAAVVTGGKAYLFIGKSGTGKSTHARLWLSTIKDTGLLNDDNPVVYFDDSGIPHVSGSPWSGKTPCYIRESYPLGGVVKLLQASRNRIYPMKLIESFCHNLLSVSSLRISRDYMLRLERLIERLVQSDVRFMNLHALPDNNAAMLCHSNLTETAYSEKSTNIAAG